MNALGRMILADIERGIDTNAYDAITTGPPRPKRDRTIPAAPLGWVPDAPEEGTP